MFRLTLLLPLVLLGSCSTAVNGEREYCEASCKNCEEVVLVCKKQGARVVVDEGAAT